MKNEKVIYPKEDLGFFPESMQDFIDNFATDKQCMDYLASIKWKHGFVCPYCKHSKAWTLGRNIRKCKECRKDVSVLVDTALEHTQIPIRLWLQAVWLTTFSKQGISALELAKMLGIKREKTGWDLLQKIRGSMIKTSTDLLSGLVEIDEVFLGGEHSGKRGRGALGKTLILVAVEDKKQAGFGRVRMSVIKNAEAETLLKAIQNMVAVDSTIRTDQHKGYPIITKHGYKHEPVAKVSYELGEDNTPLVHRIASLLKRWLLGTHQGGVQAIHIPSYLNEYTFRFNRRKSKSRGKLFYRLIENLVKK